MLYFLKFEDLTCNFCAFSCFIYFSVSFYPIWIKIISKFRENVGLHFYRLGLVRTGPEPVLGPRSFPVFLKKIERTGTVGPLEPVTVRSGSRSHSGSTNRTLKHYLWKLKLILTRNIHISPLLSYLLKNAILVQKNV